MDKKKIFISLMIIGCLFTIGFNLTNEAQKMNLDWQNRPCAICEPEAWATWDFQRTFYGALGIGCQVASLGFCCFILGIVLNNKGKKS